MSDERDLLIGRAVRRLIELTGQDEVLRAGLDALARSILEMSAASAPEITSPVAPGPDGAALAGPVSAPTSTGDSHEPGTGTETAAPDTAAAENVIEPMDPVTLARLIDEARQQMAPVRLDAAGTSREQVVGGEGRGHAGDPIDDGTSGARQSTLSAADGDSILTGLTERTRLKAAVTRAVIERLATGLPVDEALIHQARSAHCSLWVLDLPEPDAVALTSYAECLTAVADGTELVRLLREHHPDDRPRFEIAVRHLAAVQSALRLATSRLRRTNDEDQAATFRWLKNTTSAEHIFVERYMRLDDPLDPSELSVAVDPIRAELAAVHEETNRQETRGRRLRQVRYHADRIAKGKGYDHDADKIIEAVSELVENGLPPSNLELRGLLMPILDRLPPAPGRPSAYGRVLDDLERNRERRPAAAAKAPAARKKSVSNEVRRAASLLRGTEAVIIGGERRVEAERALCDAFGLAELTWFTLSDDPTLGELERVISRPQVSVVIQLIRWSRHRHGDAADLAEEHGKPFVRVPGGYNANALARAILDQASERLAPR